MNFAVGQKDKICSDQDNINLEAGEFERRIMQSATILSSCSFSNLFEEA